MKLIFLPCLWPLAAACPIALHTGDKFASAFAEISHQNLEGYTEILSPPPASPYKFHSTTTKVENVCQHKDTLLTHNTTGSGDGNLALGKDQRIPADLNLRIDLN